MQYNIHILFFKKAVKGLKTIAILPNANKDKDLKYTKEVVEILHKKARIITDVPLKIPHVETVSVPKMIDEADIFVALGGDGTMLRLSALASKKGQPILGINLGTLGFLSEVEKDKISTAINHLADENYTIEERAMLDGCVIRNRNKVAHFTALNDFVVSRSSFKRVVDIEVHIDSCMVDSYISDGIILATPTGSTAYSLSAGGPIVDPRLDVIIVTPICPHSLKTRPIITPASKTVDVVVKSKSKRDMLLTVDGQTGYELENGDIIRITNSNITTKLIKLNGLGFYDTLRKKFQTEKI